MINELMRRRAMMGGETLPYDAEVEYLRATGTQYIDTGIYGEMGLDFTVRFKTTDRASYYGVLGARLTSSADRYTILTNTAPGAFVTMGTNSNQVNVSDQYLQTDYHTYKKDGLACYVDNAQVGTFNILTFTTPKSILLFAITTNGTIGSQLKGDICYCKFSKNGVILADFIPVRVGQVGYMYDKVSKQLFSNVGTGSFIIGNDIN